MNIPPLGGNARISMYKFGISSRSGQVNPHLGGMIRDPAAGWIMPVAASIYGK